MVVLLFNVSVVPWLVLPVLVMHVSVLPIMECLVVFMLGMGLVLSSLAMISHGSSVLVVLMALFMVLWVALLLVHDSLIVVCLAVTLTVSVLEVPTFNIFMLWVSAVGVLVCVAHSLEIVLRVVCWVPSFSVFVVADQRSIVFVNINILMVSDCCVVWGDDSCVVWGDYSCVVWGNDSLVVRSDHSLVMHRPGIVVDCLVMYRRGLNVVMLW